MKILIVCTVPFDTNGIASVIMNYYKNMKRDNLQIDFALYQSVNEMYRKTIKENQDNIFILPNRKKNPIGYIWKLKQLLKRERYDIMHIHGNSALMEIELFASEGIDIKRVVHGHSTQCTYHLLNNILRNRFLKSYDFALACSQAAGEWLYDKQTFQVFNNAIDAEKYCYSPQIRREMKEKVAVQNNIVIGHVGYFLPVKNHAFLLEVFREIVKREERAKLILIGDGKLKSNIERDVNKLNLDDKVIFVGTTDRVSDYMQAMDVFVLPSIHEGLPLVGIEAQASGLPCVFSDGITKEVKVTDNVEFLSLQEGKEVWAERILHKVGSHIRKNELEAIRNAGFDIKAKADELLTFYHGLVDGE